MFLWSLKSLVGRNQYFINQSVTFVCFASLKFELIGTAFSIIFFSTSQLTLFFLCFFEVEIDREDRINPFLPSIIYYFSVVFTWSLHWWGGPYRWRGPTVWPQDSSAIWTQTAPARNYIWNKNKNSWMKWKIIYFR